MSDCPDCRCSEFEKCLKILHLILDKEASDQEQDYFYSHIEQCIVCFAHYNIEKEIRSLVKTRMSNKPIPILLLDDIRSQIFDKKP